MEARLVVHLGAFGDPVPQIDVRQAERARLLDLPEHVEGAVAAFRIGVVEGIDGRKAVVQHVEDGHHAQRAGLAVGRRIPEFDQPRVHAALQQELRVLVDAVVVHAAAGMAGALVVEIQLVVLRLVAQPQHAGLEAAVLLPGTALAAVGPEFARQHAQRGTGLATVAVGAVGEHAAAAESARHQVGIHIALDQVAGRGDLGPGLPVRQVAARVGRRRVELQGLQRKVVELRHCGPGEGGSNASQYKESNRQVIGARAVAACTLRRKRSRGISRAPSDARWAVFCWQSIHSAPWRRHRQTSAARAIFEASVTWANMDSPKTARPMPMQYRPPTSRPSCQISMLWAWPARWNSS